MQQYLTEPDGTIKGDAAALEAAGILIVRPVPPPRTPGMIPVEGEPEQRDGVWWQTWRLIAAPPPDDPHIPDAVSPLQMRRALRQQGLMDAVTAYVAVQDADTQDAWEYAVEIRRDDALIASAADALGKTPAEIDDLFRLAASI